MEFLGRTIAWILILGTSSLGVLIVYRLLTY